MGLKRLIKKMIEARSRNPFPTNGTNIHSMTAGHLHVRGGAWMLGEVKTVRASVSAHATFQRGIEPIRIVSRRKWLIWLVGRCPVGSATDLKQFCSVFCSKSTLPPPSSD
jgi:hypothetical protein